MNLADKIKGKTVFITGAKKNVGKTTFLNYAANVLRHNKIGLLSIGIDGESTDGVFGNPKPKVIVEKDDLFISCDSALKNAQTRFKILNVYPFFTAIGRPVLARALRKGAAEISGPENNSQLKSIIDDMRSQGAETIFIDGAVDRITQSAEDGGCVLVYISEVKPENIISSVNRIRMLKAASQCEICDVGNTSDFVRIAGALTLAKIEKIDIKGLAGENKGAKPVLLADNPAKVFLTWDQWLSVNSRFEVKFVSKPELFIFIVNLYNINVGNFEAKISDSNLASEIVYNPYEN